MAAGALSSVTFRDYIIATCIGKAFSVAIEVMTGLDMLDFGNNIMQLFGMAALSLLMMWGYRHYVKRCKSAR